MTKTAKERLELQAGLERLLLDIAPAVDAHLNDEGERKIGPHAFNGGMAWPDV